MTHLTSVAASITRGLLGMRQSAWAVQDLRIIAERGSDLHYYHVPLGFQKSALVWLRFVLGLAVISLLALATSAIALQLDRAKLEKSHRDVHSALESSLRDAGDSAAGEGVQREELLRMAERIRLRDESVRHLLHFAGVEVKSEIGRLQASIDETGLSEKSLALLDTVGSVGGDSEWEAGDAFPELLGSLQQEVASQERLRNVLRALPDKMPLNQYSVSSGFGMRKHPITGRVRLHAGIDMISHGADEVHPVLPGLVVFAGMHQSFGNTVVIQHARGVETLYAHLRSVDVEVGEEVDPAIVIGHVGNSGLSTGKHLHFEVSVGGYPVNPERIISAASHVWKTEDSSTPRRSSERN